MNDMCVKRSARKNVRTIIQQSHAKIFSEGLDSLQYALKSGIQNETYVETNAYKPTSEVDTHEI